LIPLGASYPNATGHNDGNDEAMPLEGGVSSLQSLPPNIELLQNAGICSS
jgi:hypothetical protein